MRARDSDDRIRRGALSSAKTHVVRRLLLGIVVVVAGAVAWNLRPTPAPPPEGRAGRPPAGEGTSIGDLSFFRFRGGEEKVQVRARAMSGEEGGVMHLSGVEVRFPFVMEGEEKHATVTADECDYDTARESARFRGNVHVATEDGFELFTEKLHYDAGRARVTSDASVRFARGRASGSAKGMVYRTDADELQLRSDVSLRVEGEAGGPPTLVRSQRGRASRQTRVIRFQGDVLVEQGPRTLRSNRLQLTLDPEMQRIVRAVGIGGVDARVSQGGILPGETRAAEGERRLLCGRLDVDFREAGVLESALAVRNASLEVRPGRGEAPEERKIAAPTLRFRFDEQGRLETLVGQAGAGSRRAAARARRQGRRAATAPGADRRPQDRDEGRGRGSPARVVLTTVPGAEHDRGVARRVECGRFTAQVEPGSGRIASAELEGSVSFEEGSRRAWSDRASYDEPAGSLTLSGGGPRVQDEEGSELQAETIRLATRGGGIEAEGGVRHTIEPRGRGGERAFLGGAEPTQVVSGRLDYDPAARTARYTDNALLRSGEDEIRAPVLVLEDPEEGTRRLYASGGTSSVLHPRPGRGATASPGGSAEADGTPREPEPVKTRSLELVYEENAGQVVYTGDVEIRQGDILTLSPRAVVTLNAAGDDVDKMVAGEPVEVRQGARRANGRTGTYTLADETLVLVGDEVVLQDAGRSVKGRALTFKVGEDRIRIDGGEEARTEAVFETKGTPRP